MVRQLEGERFLKRQSVSCTATQEAKRQAAEQAQVPSAVMAAVRGAYLSRDGMDKQQSSPPTFPPLTLHPKLCQNIVVCVLDWWLYVMWRLGRNQRRSTAV